MSDDVKFGSTPEECMETGLPDEYGCYYFEALITNSNYCMQDSQNPHMFFNVCSFTTETPLPKLNLDRVTRIASGELVGRTIELFPMTRYKIRAEQKYNERYNRWQYVIKSVWETEVRSSDKLDNYLYFLLNGNTYYNKIKEIAPDLVEKVLDDDDYYPERVKGVREDSFDNLIRDIRLYRDYIPLIAKFAAFPEINIKSVLEMSNIGTSPTQALKMIEDNPYLLTKLSRFGWKRVDKIALKIKPEMACSTQRLICFCTYILEEIANASDGGHTWIYKNCPSDVKHSMQHLIRDNVPECKDVVRSYFETEIELTKTSGCGINFYVDEEKIGLAKYYKSEKSILYHLNRINEGLHMSCIENLDDAIAKTDKWMSDNVGEEVHLTEEQKRAIESTLTNDVTILTAHAGAGKSTTIRGILDLWKDKRIGCCALAAKAAMRIKEATGKDSYTIHRLLGYQQGKFTYNENNPLPYDIIVVDECSMINVSLFLSIVKAVPNQAKIILVFDDAQLPAIGAGSVAKDLLNSTFNIQRLTKVHRQAAKSGIKIDANKIRVQEDVFVGDYDYNKALPREVIHGEKGDMCYYPLQSRVSVHEQVIDIYKRLISEDMVYYGDITIIVPMKSNMENCMDSFNQEIQEILLGEETQMIKSGTYQDKDKSPRIFKLGCKVIRKKNNYELNVFNGETGQLVEISPNYKGFTIRFEDGRLQEFPIGELANFELAYALTVHSMQGSENKVIIFVMDTAHYILLDSTLFYTAVTRAKDKGYVVFQPDAYHKALTDDKVCARQTFLPLLMNSQKDDITDYDDFIEEEYTDLPF